MKSALRHTHSGSEDGNSIPNHLSFTQHGLCLHSYNLHFCMLAHFKMKSDFTLFAICLKDCLFALFILCFFSLSHSISSVVQKDVLHCRYRILSSGFVSLTGLSPACQHFYMWTSLCNPVYSQLL